MRRVWKRAAPMLAGVALLTASTGCVDLDVPNPNAPDVERLETDALLSGAFYSWYGHDQVLLTWGFSALSFQHSTHVANAGATWYSAIPRQALRNEPSAGDHFCPACPLPNFWRMRYAAIGSARLGLRRLGESGNAMKRAYAKFVQGLAHGSLALAFDSAYVYDETMEPGESVLHGYGAVMEAALGYLEEAAVLAADTTFDVPAEWMSRPVSSAELARLAYSWRARFRASVARTPAERAAVDWDAVVADVDQGLAEGDDWAIDAASATWWDFTLGYSHYWGMMSYWVLGMADQSGAYQGWMAMPITPTTDRTPFIMVTPDTRFPQGPDEATQIANPGAYFQIVRGGNRYRLWQRADRGTWRWSYYRDFTWDWWIFPGGPARLVTHREGELLRAEAAYWAGDYDEVARIVNETRTLYGLNETDAQGTNTSCVPRMPPTHPTNPNGCGDLWEMFKWEKRLETRFLGPDRVGWWFDGRGWGDLMEGSYLQWPVPYFDLEALGQPLYDVGGVGGLYGAPVGTYGY